MKSLTDVIRDVIRLPVIDTLGWTLLHFLWQGALIALILAALMWLLKNQHPSIRYGLACGGLALMFVCPIITYLVLDSSKSTKPTVETALPQADVAQPVLVADNTQVQPVINPVVFAPEGSQGTKKSWLERHLKPLLPYLVAFWCIGVLVLSARLLGGLWILRKLRTRLTKPVSTVLVSQLNNVAQRLGLARQVQLRESLVATVPLVVGWLRPMILLPSSVISGLSVKQLEMILAHELAHIRRHDYLVNLLQSVIETLLFYHPAVWWVSNQIRKEREHCCDDLAVKVCGGDKQSYAHALADLEDLRPKVQLVQAANGGSLLKRIIRLADKALPGALEPKQWIAGLSMIFISMILFAVIGLSLTVAQGDEITLQLAVADQQGRPSEPYVTEFIEKVKTLSNGKITIEPVWDAGNDTEAGFETGVVQHITKGDFDLGLVASRAWDNEGVTSFQALQAPFLITNDALAKAVATSDTATKMLESLSSAGVVGLTLWPEGLRYPFAFEPYSKPFLSPEDFAGTTIQAFPSSVTSAILKALGATSIYEYRYGQSVLDGRIQGVEAGLIFGQGTTMSFPGTATGNVVFSPKFQVLVANSAAFERLSDEQQNILREAATQAQKKSFADYPSEADAATDFCANGGRIVMTSDEQLAAFERAMQPVYTQLEQDPATADYIAAIRNLKASTEPSPGIKACKPTPPDLMYRGTLPPDGIYSHTNTEEELLAKGARPNFAHENPGTITWSITNGQLDSQGDCSWVFNSTGEVLEVSLPVGSCTDVAVTNDFLWRQLEDGSLEFLFLSSTDPGAQLQVDNRSMFEGLWQKIE
jgi:TRAP-type C4-dicarboxylate transport system substrate-binding protein/beta-lactamase regulating signal transducer with metallopeptidase domain